MNMVFKTKNHPHGKKEEGFLKKLTMVCVKNT